MQLKDDIRRAIGLAVEDAKLTEGQRLSLEHAWEITKLIRPHYQNWRGQRLPTAAEANRDHGYDDDCDDGYDAAASVLTHDLERLELETLGTLLRALQIKTVKED
jgi:hypothetical protein